MPVSPFITPEKKPAPGGPCHTSHTPARGNSFRTRTAVQTQSRSEKVKPGAGLHFLKRSGDIGPQVSEAASQPSVSVKVDRQKRTE